MFDQRAGSLIRIASVAIEPSFMATTLMIFGAFGATLVTMDVAFRTRAWVFPTVLTLGVVLASTSTTGYVGLATLLLLLGLRQPGRIAVLGLLAILGIAAILALAPDIRDVAYGFTIGKSSSGSYQDRTATIWKAFDQFLQRPWLGWGWGSDYSYSMISILLCNTGIVGTLLFGAAFGGTVVALRAARSPTLAPGNGRLRAYALSAENALIVYFAQNAVSGFKYVVADFWCFWGLAIAIPSCLIASMLRHSTAPSFVSGFVESRGLASRPARQVPQEPRDRPIVGSWHQNEMGTALAQPSKSPERRRSG